MSGEITKAPFYDRWSLGSGERELEMQRRRSASLEVAQLRAEMPERKAVYERGAEEARAGYEKFKADLAAKYGSDGAASKELTLRAADGGDSVALSPEAKQMLLDFRQLETMRYRTEAVERSAANIEKEYAQRIAFAQTIEEYASNGFDQRFTENDTDRLAAFNRWNAASARMAGPEFGLEARRRASGQPETNAELEAMSKLTPDGSGLFAVDGRGNVFVDAKGLDRLGPEQQAIEQLKRLVTALTENNGLNQLRDGLIAALDGQNRTIADKAAALTAATKPDATGG